MIDEVTNDLDAELSEVVSALRKELARTRTGRAAPSLLESIHVEYYGVRTPLSQMAGLSAPEPRLLVIQPYDAGSLGDIEKALMQSDLGLTPVNDGKLLRIPIPELTQERRQEFVKHVRKVGEEFRVSIRNHRREANDMLKALEKDKEITEDDQRKGQERIQKLTDARVKEIDEIVATKEAEIMEV